MRSNLVEAAPNVGRVGAVAAEKAMLAEEPDIAGLSDGSLGWFGNVVGIGKAGDADLHQARHLFIAEAGEGEIEAEILQRLELSLEEFEVPAGIERQLVVGDDVGLLLGLAQAGEFDHRHLRQAELPGCEQPAVSGDDAIVAVDEDRVGETEGANGGSNLRHLRVGVRSRIAGIGNEV